MSIVKNKITMKNPKYVSEIMTFAINQFLYSNVRKNNLGMHNLLKVNFNNIKSDDFTSSVSNLSISKSNKALDVLESKGYLVPCNFGFGRTYQLTLKALNEYSDKITQKTIDAMKRAVSFDKTESEKSGIEYISYFETLDKIKEDYYSKCNESIFQ